MRNVILNLAVTLDGFIEGPNGEIDWCIMDEEMDFKGFLEQIDAIFYGRLSFEKWGNFKPDSNANDIDKEFWEQIHEKKKYVFSRSLKSAENAELIKDGLKESIMAIKKENGKDIWLYGGAQLTKSFIQMDLIDVYQLSVHPILLGAGIPLFDSLKTPIQLNLVNTRTFQSGVVELTYQRK